MNAGPLPGELTDPDRAVVDRVRRLVQASAGIAIGDAKAAMVRARLASCMSATGHRSIRDYLDHVEAPGSEDARAALISAMTTKVTHFFREDHHFDVLARDLVPAWASRPGLRSIWSAGCSSGQEPYSIAMTLRSAGLDRRAARVLATDIDRSVLSRAAGGIYVEREITSLPPALLARDFSRVDRGWQVNEALRRMVTFRMLNLNREWPVIGRFDAIFCRNVAIYFDPPTQHKLWQRLLATLRPGGRLFVGHSERIPDALTGSRVLRLGRTMYARPHEGGQ